MQHHFTPYHLLGVERGPVQASGGARSEGETPVQLEVVGGAAGRLRPEPEELLRMPEDEPRDALGRMRLLLQRLPSGLPRPAALRNPKGERKTRSEPESVPGLPGFEIEK